MRFLLVLAFIIFCPGLSEARGPIGYINGSAANGAFPAGDNQPVTFALSVDAKKTACTTFVLTGGVQGKCDMTALFVDGFVMHGKATTISKTGGVFDAPYDILVSPPFNCIASGKAAACSVIIQAKAVAGTVPPVVTPPVTTPPTTTPPVVTPPTTTPVNYTWSYGGTNGTSLTFTKSTVVRWGRPDVISAAKPDGTWVEKTFPAGTYTCSDDMFSDKVDPLPGQGKYCYVRDQ